jgi:hypothetical protein
LGARGSPTPRRGRSMIRHRPSRLSSAAGGIPLRTTPALWLEHAPEYGHLLGLQDGCDPSLSGVVGGDVRREAVQEDRLLVHCGGDGAVKEATGIPGER